MAGIDISSNTNTITVDAARLAATVAALQAKWPGRACVSPGEALTVLPGVPPRDPEGAAIQRRMHGSYPFPVALMGNRRVVLIADIAAALCALPTADGDCRIAGDARSITKYAPGGQAFAQRRVQKRDRCGRGRPRKSPPLLDSATESGEAVCHERRDGAQGTNFGHYNPPRREP